MKENIRFYVFTFVVLMSIVLTACVSGFSATQEMEKSVYKTKGGEIGFLLEGYEYIEQGPYDLYCKSDDAYMGVFVYNVKDIASGSTKKDILDWQVEDLMSKRENPTKYGELKEIRYMDKIIYQKIYTADKDDMKHIYFFNIIDFGNKEDTFAYVLFSTSVSYGEEHKEDFNNILKAAEHF